MTATLSLVVKRTIAAPPERLFAAWTDPEQIVDWWGPAGVTCEGADADVRVGGQYRISNRLPDGRLIHISGEYEVVEPPRRLVYSWRVEEANTPSERVTVRFETKDSGSEVTIVHERINDVEAKDEHEIGWQGCLDGVASYVSG